MLPHCDITEQYSIEENSTQQDIVLLQCQMYKLEINHCVQKDESWLAT